MQFYFGIMQNRMETTIFATVYGDNENRMETTL